MASSFNQDPSAVIEHFKSLSPEDQERAINAYNAHVDERIKKAKGARAKERILGTLSRGLNYLVGRNPGPSARQRRLAQSGASRQAAMDALEQDPYQHQGEYFEGLSAFGDAIMERAQASLSDEDNEEIEIAKLRAERANKLLELMSSDVNFADEDKAARKAAAKYLTQVSRGTATGQTLNKDLSGLDSIYAVDRFRDYVREFSAGGPKSAATRAALNEALNEMQLTEPEMNAGELPSQLDANALKTVNDQLGLGPKVDPTNTWAVYRQNRVESGDLGPDPGQLDAGQHAALISNDYAGANQAYENAMSRLSAVPGMERQIQTLAEQYLTPEQFAALAIKDEDGKVVGRRQLTLRTVYDAASGQSLENARRMDSITKSKIELAMEQMLRTGNFSPLSSSKELLSHAESKGLSLPEYAQYVKNKEELKRQDASTYDLLEAGDLALDDYAKDVRATEAVRMASPDEPPSQPATDSSLAAGADTGGDAGADGSSAAEVDAAADGDAPKDAPKRTSTRGGQRGGAELFLPPTLRDKTKERVVQNLSGRKNNAFIG